MNLNYYLKPSAPSGKKTDKRPLHQPRPLDVLVRPFPASTKKTSRSIESLIQMLNHEFSFDSIVHSSTTGLHDNWGGGECLFVNVDYSNVEFWLRKIVRERAKGKTIVALLPARTSTTYFHDYVLAEASEIRFVRGRLVMEGSRRQSPYASVVAVYSPRHSLDDGEGGVMMSMTEL